MSGQISEKPCKRESVCTAFSLFPFGKPVKTPLGVMQTQRKDTIGFISAVPFSPLLCYNIKKYNCAVSVEEELR